MNCKSCNTRIPSGKGSCPACGRSSKSTSFSSPPAQKEVTLDNPLSKSTVKRPLRLRGTQSEAEPKRPAAKSNPEKASAKSRSASVGRTPEKPGSRSEAPEESGPSLFSLDPTELRSLLAEQPELLEAGLSVLCDDGGQTVGVGYETDIGQVDLLAIDTAGDLVVVTVADRDPGQELIGGILQRVGWVREHLAKGERGVRAIVLTEPLADEVRYAAAAVAGTIDFKTYRVALSFDELHI